MAALASFTGTAEAPDIVPSELIDGFLQGLNLAPLTAEAIAWIRPGMGNVPVQFARLDILDSGGGVPAGTKAQSDQFTDVEQTTSSVQITPGFVGFRSFISDELTASAQMGVPMQFLRKWMRDIADRRDSDAHLVAATFTNSGGGLDTDPADLTWWRARTAEYRALNAEKTSAGVAFVMGLGPWATLEGSLTETSAPLPVKDISAGELFGPDSGFRGDLMGFKMFATSNAAVSGGGIANYITSIGDLVSAIGIVSNLGAGVESTRGDDAANRKGTYHNVSAWYGTGEPAPQNGVRALSDA